MKQYLYQRQRCFSSVPVGNCYVKTPKNVNDTHKKRKFFSYCVWKTVRIKDKGVFPAFPLGTAMSKHQKTSMILTN